MATFYTYDCQLLQVLFPRDSSTICWIWRSRLLFSFLTRRKCQHSTKSASQPHKFSIPSRGRCSVDFSSGSGQQHLQATHFVVTIKFFYNFFWLCSTLAQLHWFRFSSFSGISTGLYNISLCLMFQISMQECYSKRQILIKTLMLGLSPALIMVYGSVHFFK